MIDVNKIKEDFSVFQNTPNLTYLDSAATSMKPDVVIDAMNDYYKCYPYSANRGSYKMAYDVTKKVDDSRQTLAEFINADKKEIIFTKSTTSALNNISRSIESLLEQGDEIIVSELEHHSNFLPWQVLSKKLNLKLNIVKSRDQQIYIEDVENLITNKTKLIAIHHISNLLGDEVDVTKLCKVAKKNNIITVIDGAQAAPHMKIDVKQIGCDFYAFSGHKVLGPTGIGILYINETVGEKISPFEYGGDMVVPSSVDVNEYTLKEMPSKFEAGTPSIAEIIGMGEAIKYISNIGMDNIHKHCISLKKYALELISQLGDKVILYNQNIENSLLVFNIKDVAVHDAVSASFLNEVTFDQDFIALRDGQHCNNMTMRYVLQEKSVLRASFYFYNTKEDVEKLVNKILEIYEVWH